MTQKDQFFKGINYLFGSLPLIFLGPYGVYNAFINKQNMWHYLVLIIAILICLTAVFLIFRGLKLIMNSIFEK
jgi:hypothetical protein